jgi:1,4-dihydroxy-2-naphthoate octaprenyltransferase
MTDQPVNRDERTVVIENASYRLAYLVISFGVLVSVAYRSFILKQSNWDLLALVVLGGVTATLYQGAHKVLSRRWMLATVITVMAAGLIAFVIALLHLR